MVDEVPISWVEAADREESKVQNLTSSRFTALLAGWVRPAGTGLVEDFSPS